MDDNDPLMLTIGLRMPAELAAEIDAAAKADGFTNRSEWMRVVLLRAAKATLDTVAARP